MKTKVLHLCAMLVSLGVLIVSGCSTMTGDGETYTLKETKFDVETAIQRYRNANVGGAVTLAEQQNVAAVHKAYQQAFNEAFIRANSNLNAPTPLNVRQLADRLTSAIQTIPE